MTERPLAPYSAIKEYALKHLAQGRADFDVPHTQAVAYYASLLASEAGVDTHVLETVAWFHDMGYAGLFDEQGSTEYNNVMDRKALHMERSTTLTKEFFRTSEAARFFSRKQIARVIYLVSTHDDLENLSSFDQFVFMEADTLGAIDLQRVPFAFDHENGMKYITKMRERRVPRFVTPLGKTLLGELLPKYIEHLERHRFT